MSASVLVVKTAIRGYYVYQTVWDLCIGDSFFTLHEERNVHDNHAMEVYGDENPGMIVGSLASQPLPPQQQWGSWFVRLDCGAFTTGNIKDLPLFYKARRQDL